MATYDIHANPGGPGFLLNIQSDFVDGLATRVVIPVLPLDIAPAPAARLNPVVEIHGVRHSIVTEWLASVRARDLGVQVTSLREYSTEITDAVDFLLHGY